MSLGLVGVALRGCRAHLISRPVDRPKPKWPRHPPGGRFSPLARYTMSATVFIPRSRFFEGRRREPPRLFEARQRLCALAPSQLGFVGTRVIIRAARTKLVFPWLTQSSCVLFGQLSELSTESDEVEEIDG